MSTEAEFDYRHALATMIAIDAANALELDFVGSGSRHRIRDLTFEGDRVRRDDSLIDRGQTGFCVLAKDPDGEDLRYQAFFRGVMPEDDRIYVANTAGAILDKICRSY